MRRIGRWMLNALTVLSLLLCVMTCLLWVRSYHAGNAVEWDGLAGRRGIIVSRESFGPYWDSYVGDDIVVGGGPYATRVTSVTAPPHSNTVSWDVPIDLMSAYVLSADLHSWHFAGFGYGKCGAGSSYFGAIVIPMWFAAAVTVLLPGRWIYQHFGRRELPEHCGSCGYCLKGNLSGVCPECGMKIAEAK